MELFMLLTPKGQDVPKCAWCGNTDIRLFHIDHKRPRMRDEIKERFPSEWIRIYVKKHRRLAKKRLQILCVVCHIQKNRMDYQQQEQRQQHNTTNLMDAPPCV